MGPVSRFNAEGNYQIHRDRPMETAYRLVEWHWEEWRGRYDSEEKSKLVEVPYKRYPRTFVPPPSVEFMVVISTDNKKLVIAKDIEYTKKNKECLIHIINLFLEIFGECNVFSEKLNEIIKAPIKRLNWRVLPPGQRPWSKLSKEIEPIVKKAPHGNQEVIWSRLEEINKHDPDFLAIGQAGFHGYIIFGFTKRNVYLCESIYVGNATYVFDERWETLSKMTKAQVLEEKLQTDRIIHRLSWNGRVRKLLKI